jgi:hypothetical protein
MNNLMEFVPTNNLSKEEKINAIARFAIYYGLIILIFNLDNKWLSITVILLIISYCLGYYEDFEEVKKTKGNCVMPTQKNPFMNFTLDDYINNNDRKEACSYDKSKDMMRKEFRKDIIPDPADLWGTNISDRQFFTMPWTTIVNDQTEFGNWLYGSGGECKNLGINCDKNRDNRYHQSRYYR